jgi:hypothetical protein
MTPMRNATACARNRGIKSGVVTHIGAGAATQAGIADGCTVNLIATLFHGAELPSNF